MRLAVDEREATVVLDMMAAAQLVSVAMMVEYAAPRVTAREPNVLPAIALAGEQARSPMEVRLRLLWVLDAELPAPLVNCEILDLEGHPLGEVDLLDWASGMGAEYDGGEHRGVLRQAADVSKEDRLRAVGLELARVTGLDMGDPALVVRRLRATRARALAKPASERRWVARPRRDDLHAKIQERLARQLRYEAWEAERLDGSALG
jgi:hypothetical protein